MVLQSLLFIIFAIIFHTFFYCQRIYFFKFNIITSPVIYNV